MELHWNKIQKKLRKELDENRYEHTLGVMYTASCLAMAHGLDMEKARIAGLLHDCAKCIPNPKKLALCQKAGLQITEFEKNHPFLLHARLGAYLAEREYEIHEADVLEAIRWHTTGKPDMTLLEKVIYIADYIEPNRNKAPHLDRLRALAFRDMDRCMYEILEDTVTYLIHAPAGQGNSFAVPQCIPSGHTVIHAPAGQGNSFAVPQGIPSGHTVIHAPVGQGNSFAVPQGIDKITLEAYDYYRTVCEDHTQKEQE